MTPFHAIMTAAELREIRAGEDRLTAAYASADIEVYPFQVAAAQFALRSPFLKGAVLADEGSLGKTIESLLVISQMWYEGREKILLVVPTPLLVQWQNILEERFSLPYTVLTDSPDFNQPSVILTTYDFVYANIEAVSEIPWDVAAFDEAHRLSKCYEPDSRAARLKNALAGSYKLLMTASPMRNSIMDLYGLIYFIDEDELGDADEFYKRYFRKPENYYELSAQAAYYCFRTLRSQVQNYVKIPNRLIVTANVTPIKAEQNIADKVSAYLEMPDKTAFPKMDKWELSLMMNKALSSSAWAIAGFCDTAYGRSQEAELGEITETASAVQPKDTNKGKQLLKAIKLAFTELKKRGAKQKAIIFTEYNSTLGFLSVLLSDTYETVAFDGKKSSDYSVIEKFRDEAEILITTDIAAEGFNLEFCSFVINFDLPYNIQTLEQRIMRCHRQGQQNDVIVLNFLDKNNIADVRILELINKRVAQFDGIVGGSDDVVGNFSENATDGLTEIFKTARNRKDIEREFAETLTANTDELSSKITAAENALFTTFTPEIAQKITITPKLVRDRTAEINAKMWELVKYFFTGKQGYYTDDETQTLKVGITPQKVFTGASLRKREYSIADRSISLTSSIIKNVIAEIFWVGIPDSGTIYAAGLDFDAEICYTKAIVKAPGSFFGRTNFVFAGLAGERVLSDGDCRKIMDLPVVSFTVSGNKYGECDGITKPKKPHKLEDLIDTAPILKRYALETNSGIGDEISRINTQAKRRKNDLSRDIERLRRELKQYDNAPDGIAERVKNEKKKATATRELKQREQSVFLNCLKIDTEAEHKIAEITAEIGVSFYRYFAVRFMGSNNG